MKTIIECAKKKVVPEGSQKLIPFSNQQNIQNYSFYELNSTAQDCPNNFKTRTKKKIKAFPFRKGQV